MKTKIHCNDQVIVLTGKYKGQCGIVENILHSNKVIIKGINLVKKHSKYKDSIIQKEMPIDISNVAIFNVSTNKPDNIIFSIKENKKIRIFKSNGKIIN